MTNDGSTRRGVLFGTGMAAVSSSVALAQTTPQPSPASMAAPANTATNNASRVNSGTVGVISGGVDGTYIRIAADLASVLDDGDRLRILPVIGKGSVQNISDIIYLHGIDLGIVQSDVLGYVLKQNLFPGVNKMINYIAKLYDEEIHILARREIARVEDLDGKKVNIDLRGSGTGMTASVIFDKLKIAIQPTYETQADALDHLRSGQIAALVYVTGKPATLFARVAEDSGLHFLSLPATPALLDTYLPAVLPHESYPTLVPVDGPVETMAVGSVMAVFAWQPNTERYLKVARFISSFWDKFPQFQKPPRHAKWREVNLAAQVPGWTRFTGIPNTKS